MKLPILIFLVVLVGLGLIIPIVKRELFTIPTNAPRVSVNQEICRIPDDGEGDATECIKLAIHAASHKGVYAVRVQGGVAEVMADPVQVPTVILEKGVTDHFSSRPKMTDEIIEGNGSTVIDPIDPVGDLFDRPPCDPQGWGYYDCSGLHVRPTMTDITTIMRLP